MTTTTSLTCDHRGPITLIGLHRPEVRNAIDAGTAQALLAACEAFDADPDQRVAILYGHGDHFCAGADLKAYAAGDALRLSEEGPGPLGPTRLALSKPLIAAIEGYAVAGGLELALWADLRVGSTSAALGVLCRRWGVPLIDGGTVRLPRLIGLSRALDLVLTGRLVYAEEAYGWGLLNRLVPAGQALDAAFELATSLAHFPQATLRADRDNARSAFDLPEQEALRAEFRRAYPALLAEGRDGASRFRDGAGRHASFDDDPGST